MVLLELKVLYSYTIYRCRYRICSIFKQSPSLMMVYELQISIDTVSCSIHTGVFTHVV